MVCDIMIDIARKHIFKDTRDEIFKFTGVSVDMSRLEQLKRDRLMPGIRLTLPSIPLEANRPYLYQLPTWIRQVIIQNNTDLSGASVPNVNLVRTLDGTPPTPGGWVIRPGQMYSDDIYTSYLGLLCTSSILINSGNVGCITIEVST